MKRHQLLIPFSREHHEGLILARLLQHGSPAYKGMPTDPFEKREYAARLYDSVFNKHFVEEEILFAKLGDHPSIDSLIKEILSEHLRLREMFENLKNESNVEDALHQLGKTLEDHIRKEERVLFPLIQEHWPDNVLNTFI